MLLLLPVLLSAQSTFFVERTLVQAQLSLAATAKYATLQDTNHSQSVKIVVTDDVRTAQQDGILRFFLPGSLDTIVAEAVMIEDDTLSGFSWSGELTSHLGYVHFNINDGETNGFMTINGDFYDLVHADSCHQFLVLLEKNSADAGCGTPPYIVPPPNITGPLVNQCDYSPDRNTCPSLISVLVLIMPDAQTFIENNFGQSLQTYIKQNEASVNLALQNSDIPNKSVRMEFLVKSGFQFDPDSLVENDLAAFRIWSDSARSSFGADLVVLLCKQYYPGIGGVADIPDFPNDELACSIIAAQSSKVVPAFAHELGHNFGCRHNWKAKGGNDDTPICAHAHRFGRQIEPVFGGPGHINLYRTILSIPGFTGTFIDSAQIPPVTYIVKKDLIHHYSNPTINYDGLATGSDAGYIADNAQQIRNTGCDVAEYRGCKELAAFPSFSPLGCHPRDTITFSAGIQQPECEIPGISPYSVEWYWNTSGIFTDTSSYQPLGSGDPLEVVHPACPRYWVKCVIQSADGVTISRIFKVSLVPLRVTCRCVPPAPGGEDDRSNLNATIFHNISPYPNPVEAGSDLQFATSTVWYELVDMRGRILLSGAPFLGGSLLIPQDASSGLYFLRLYNKNAQIENQKLFILQSR